MKIFLFYFEMATKITGSAQNYRVGRVSGNTPIFLGLIKVSSFKNSENIQKKEGGPGCTVSNNKFSSLTLN